MITPTEYGLLGTLLAHSAAARSNLSTLTQQASSGLIADTYAGLGGGASASLDLRPQIAGLQTRQANIDAATTRLNVTQTAMTQAQGIASSFLASLNNLNGLNASEVDSVAANARAALGEVADLLNSKDGNVYVFAGQDTQNPPVPAAGSILSSGFYTQIAASVAGLATNGAAATAAATLATAGSNAPGTSPFSAWLSQPAAALQTPLVETGAGRTQAAGLLASANTAAVSQGGSTTGSYMRDLMRALATLGSLDPSQLTDPNFAPLIQDTRDSLTGAVSAMATDVGVLGDAQSALTRTQTQLANTQIALTTQVDHAENVDMAATLSNLTMAQTQLQASYQLIASLSGLSLQKYLPGG